MHFAPPLLLKLWNLSVPFPGVALIFLAVVGLFVALLLMLLRLCTALYVHEIVSGRVELIIVCDLPPEAQLHEQPTLNLLLRFGQDVRQHSSTVDPSDLGVSSFKVLSKTYGLNCCPFFRSLDTWSCPHQLVV